MQALTHVVQLLACLRFRMRGTDYHEFVAADAIQPVIAEERARRVRELTQHAVALLMPEMVVHLVQADHIRIHAHHRPDVGAPQLLHIAVVCIAVEQSRQGVLPIDFLHVLGD